MCASSYKQYRHVLKYKYGSKLFWYKEMTGKWAHRCAITYQLLENYQKIHKTSTIPWLIFVILVFSCWLYGISRRTDAQNYWWKGPFQTSIWFFPLRQESILAVMGWEAWYILDGSQVYHRVNRETTTIHTHIYSQFRSTFGVMVLGSWTQSFEFCNFFLWLHI